MFRGYINITFLDFKRNLIRGHEYCNDFAESCQDRAGNCG